MSNVHGIDDATALVGMPELVVRAQVLRDGEWWLAVETRSGPLWCPGCGVRAVGHGRSRTTVRDLPIAGVPTVLVFARRRLRCPESLCEVRTWSEHVDAIVPRASLTERARDRLAAMVNIDGFSIAAAGVEFGVGWHAANAAAESFFGTLKREHANRRRWATRAEARRDLIRWIEGWYNQRRLHSTINYNSPVEFEAMFNHRSEPVAA